MVSLPEQQGCVAAYQSPLGLSHFLELSVKCLAHPLTFGLPQPVLQVGSLLLFATEIAIVLKNAPGYACCPKSKQSPLATELLASSLLCYYKSTL